MNAELPILIADDEEITRDLLEHALRSAGFDVFAASSGTEALSEAARRAWQLFVLDVNMPGLDGIEVCRRLRAMPLTAGSPILFLTSSNDAATIDAAFAAGATDYLCKPIHTRLLLARINNLIRLQRLMDERQTLRELLTSADVPANPAQPN